MSVTTILAVVVLAGFAASPNFRGFCLGCVDSFWTAFKESFNESFQRAQHQNDDAEEES